MAGFMSTCPKLLQFTPYSFSNSSCFFCLMNFDQSVNLLSGVSLNWPMRCDHKLLQADVFSHLDNAVLRSFR